jgi:hypothetical protein
MTESQDHYNHTLFLFFDVLLTSVPVKIARSHLEASSVGHCQTWEGFSSLRQQPHDVDQVQMLAPENAKASLEEIRKRSEEEKAV